MSLFNLKPRKDPFVERSERLERMRKESQLMDIELGMQREEKELRSSYAKKKAEINENRPKSGVRRVFGDVGRGFNRVSEHIQKNNVNANFSSFLGGSPMRESSKKGGKKVKRTEFRDPLKDLI